MVTPLSLSFFTLPAVGTFSFMLCNFLFWGVHCFHIKLGSVAPHFVRGSHDSCNRSYLYEENEQNFSYQDVISFRGYIHGRTGKRFATFLHFINALVNLICIAKKDSAESWFSAYRRQFPKSKLSLHLLGKTEQ